MNNIYYTHTHLYKTDRKKNTYWYLRYAFMSGEYTDLGGTYALYTAIEQKKLKGLNFTNKKKCMTTTKQTIYTDYVTV